MTKTSIKDRACPDCPARSARSLEVLVDHPAGCMMRCLPVQARQPLPMRWRGTYTLALVRRGIVIRQRIDSSGRGAAIDIAGPSSALPIAALDEDSSTGYAVDDVMLCLVTSESLEHVMDERRVARDLLRAQTSMRERVERIAEARTRASATSRVAALLLAIADTLSPALKTSTIPSAIQQRDLAGLGALRHESVCRSIATLESSGLIRRTAAGLEIVDRAQLEAV